MTPQYALGLFYILCVSIIWSLASILVQYIYHVLRFDSPFIVTYIGTSLFGTLLVFDCLMQVIKQKKRKRKKSYDYEYVPGHQELPSSPCTNSLSPSSPSTHSSLNLVEENNNDHRKNCSNLTTMEYNIATPIDHGKDDTSGNTWSIKMIFSDKQWKHFIIAMKIAPFWFIANNLYNASLKYTSITSSTVLSSTGSLFTYLFAIFTGEEHCQTYRLTGVLIAITGSILTGLKDAKANSSSSSENNETIWGDLASLLSAVGYGIYTVLIRKLCKDTTLESNNNMSTSIPSSSNPNNNDIHSRNDPNLDASALTVDMNVVVATETQKNEPVSMHLVLGYIGLTNMVLLLPIFLYLLIQLNNSPYSHDNDSRGTNEENGGNYRSHLNWWIFFCLVIKGLSDNVLSDYLWARSIVLTNATVASVGVGLSIPLAMLSDLFILDDSTQVFSFLSTFGALFVLVGFALVNFDINV